jgi:fluoroacetyl-CoA thioesterase
MRPGPPRGATATLEVVVGDDLTARVGGEQIHPVYGTTAIVGHIEQVCRSLLVPHLEPGEEGVGASLEVHHRAPVPVGETVVLTATVATVGPTTLVCEVLVRHGTAVVARGSFEQRVVPREAFRAEIDARRTTPVVPTTADAADGVDAVDPATVDDTPDPAGSASVR